MTRQTALRFMRAYADFLSTWGVKDAGACSCCYGLKVRADFAIDGEADDLDLENLNADEHWIWADPEYIMPRFRGPKWLELTWAAEQRGLQIGGSSYWIWVKVPGGSMTGHVASVSLRPRGPSEQECELLLKRLVEAWPEAKPR